MAKILDEFPEALSRMGPQYPYDEWFDGQVREFERGVDFHSLVESFRWSLVRHARRRGLKYRARAMGKNKLVFQIVNEDSDGPSQ